MTNQTDPAALVKAALTASEVELKTYAPHLVDGPEYDAGYHHGYQTALNRIRALADDPEAVAEIIEQVKERRNDLRNR